MQAVPLPRQSLLTDLPRNAPRARGQTFAEVTDNVAKYFLFSKTRVLCNWQCFAAVPPPFNIFSVPYYLILFVLHTFIWFGTRLHTLEEQIHLDDAFHTVKLKMSGVYNDSPHAHDGDSTDVDKAMNDGTREAKREATAMRLEFSRGKMSIVPRALRRGSVFRKHKLTSLGQKVVVAKQLSRCVPHGGGRFRL